jgi:hypothetical protein
MLEFLRCFLLQQGSSVQLQQLLLLQQQEWQHDSVCFSFAAVAKRFALTSCSALNALALASA